MGHKSTATRIKTFKQTSDLLINKWLLTSFETVSFLCQTRTVNILSFVHKWHNILDESYVLVENVRLAKIT